MSKDVEQKGQLEQDLPTSESRNPNSSQSYNVTNNNTDNETNGLETTEQVIEELEKEAKQEIHKFDKIAICVSPLLFVFFNIAYWLYYTT